MTLLKDIQKAKVGDVFGFCEPNGEDDPDNFSFVVVNKKRGGLKLQSFFYAQCECEKIYRKNVKEMSRVVGSVKHHFQKAYHRTDDDKDCELIGPLKGSFELDLDTFDYKEVVDCYRQYPFSNQQFLHSLFWLHAKDLHTQSTTMGRPMKKIKITIEEIMEKDDA